MEIQKIKISEAERELLFHFYGEDLGNEIDFNRLMPVVQKVFDTDFYEKFEEWKALINKIHNALILVDISNTYNAVVQFIRWYNGNK